MVRLSLGLIVKNEEGNLRECLEPVRSLVDEIVVVDTGSTDKTREIAQEMGARLIEFPWRNDFSAARNEMLQQARGDWFFWLDADDRVQPENAGKLNQLFSTLNGQNNAYIMDVVCQPEHPTSPTNVLPQCRLFRKHPQAGWEHRIHEQILPSLERLGYPMTFTDIQIHHVGYQDPAMLRRKVNRDLRLLRMDYATNPQDPATLYHLGLALLKIGQVEEGLKYLQEGLRYAPGKLDWVRSLYLHITQTLVKLNRRPQALQVLDQGLTDFPDDVPLWTLRGEILCQLDRFSEAEEAYLTALQLPLKRTLSCADQSLLQRKTARINLGMLYIDMRRMPLAESLFQQILMQEPQCIEALVWLGHVYLEQQDYPGIERVAGELVQCPMGNVYSDVLKAKMFLLQRRFPEARELLDRAIAQTPQMIWPRLVLSELMLLSSSSIDDCMAVQRDILRLDPSNLNAQITLERLQQLRESQNQQASSAGNGYSFTI